MEQGTRFRFAYQGRSFEFAVVETRPAPIVSITDTDLSTEVLPPLKVPAPPPARLRSLSGGDAPQEVAVRPSVEAGQELAVAAKADQYFFTSVTVDDPNAECAARRTRFVSCLAQIQRAL